MRKKFFLTGAIIGIAIVVTVNVNLSLNSQNGVLSDIALTNVEALSSEEPAKRDWYVHFVSSTSWVCSSAGNSYCP